MSIYTQTLLQAPGPTTVHTPHTKKKKYHIMIYHIMIFEGSCDTEDWSNDAEN